MGFCRFGRFTEHCGDLPFLVNMHLHLVASGRCLSHRPRQRLSYQTLSPIEGGAFFGDRFQQPSVEPVPTLLFAELSQLRRTQLEEKLVPSRPRVEVRSTWLDAFSSQILGMRWPLASGFSGRLSSDDHLSVSVASSIRLSPDLSAVRLASGYVERHTPNRIGRQR